MKTSAGSKTIAKGVASSTTRFFRTAETGLRFPFAATCRSEEKAQTCLRSPKLGPRSGNCALARGAGGFYFDDMKRHFSLSLICASGLLLAPLLPAQDAVTAAAEREQAEERHRSMNARLADLEATVVSYQNRMNEMKQQMSRLQDEIDRLKSKNDNASSGVQESLKHLQEGVLAVDKKRQDDNDKTIKALRELEKLILEKPVQRAPVSAPPRNTENTTKPAPEPTGNNTGGKETGYEYIVRSGDSLSGIVALVRTRGIKVTQAMVKEANPNVNWEKSLKVNQKLFIPSPTP